MTWYEEPISGFDVESTGIDVTEDRILQWCVADTMPGCEPVVYAEYVNPGVPIPAESTRVHGITDAEVARVGNDPVESLRRLVEELAHRLLARIPIGGMNLSYDFTMLRYECLRHGIQGVEERAGMPLAPVIDTYVLDKHADPYRRGSRTLADSPAKGSGLATHYGVTLHGAHDAVADTVASVKVGRIIGKRYHEEIGSVGKYRLHAMQVDWRYEQCRSLQDYFRYKKRPPQPDAVVDPCWPVCTDDTHIRN